MELIGGIEIWAPSYDALRIRSPKPQLSIASIASTSLSGVDVILVLNFL